MHSIQGFAFSLIGIFIPIYLLTLNYSVSKVLIFFIIYYLAGLVAAFSAVYIARHIGLQQMLIFRLPFTFVFLLLLYLLKSNDIPLSVIAFLGGWQNSLYWIPLHILFARNTKQKNVGASTGKLFAFPQMASMAGPLLGGFIAVLFGFKILFIFVFLILLVSIVPLLYMEKIKTFFKFELSQGVKLFKKYPKYFFAEIFGNIGDEVEAIIWPIFIYLSLANIAAVGVAGTLLSAGSIVFTLFIGKISDKYNKKQIIKVGAMLLLGVFMLRYFANSELVFYILTILSGFFMVLFWVPYTAKIYSIAKKNTADEFFVFREIPVTISRMIILCIALLLVNNLNLTFLTAGIAYLYFLFL